MVRRSYRCFVKLFSFPSNQIFLSVNENESQSYLSPRADAADGAFKDAPRFKSQPLNKKQINAGNPASDVLSAGDNFSVSVQRNVKKKKKKN